MIFSSRSTSDCLQRIADDPEYSSRLKMIDTPSGRVSGLTSRVVSSRIGARIALDQCRYRRSRGHDGSQLPEAGDNLAVHEFNRHRRWAAVASIGALDRHQEASSVSSLSTSPPDATKAGQQALHTNAASRPAPLYQPVTESADRPQNAHASRVSVSGACLNARSSSVRRQCTDSPFGLHDNRVCSDGNLAVPGEQLFAKRP